MSLPQSIMKPFLYSVSLCALLTTPAFAAEDKHTHHGHNHAAHAGDTPHFFGHIDVLVHGDSIYSADDKDTEISEAYTHSHAEIGFAFNEKLSIQSSVKLEGESAAGGHGGGGPAGQDRFFDDHPLLIEQLTINYDTKNYALYAGKFNPVVGIDYHDTPGIWTYQALEEYSIRERIGFGGAVKVDGVDYGQHRLDVSTFFADTTALSGSVLFDRGDTQKSDGGLSNTESFESFAVSLGGSEFYSLDVDFITDLTYRIGFAKQAAGEGGTDDETRYSLALGYNPKITETLSARTFVEYVDISHLEGEADHDRANLTAGAGLYHGPWNTAVSYTHINNTAEDVDEGKDGHVFQVSGGYRLQEGALKGLGFDVGWKTQEEEGKQRDTVGALVSYAFAF
jgi:hypothetical protein